MKFTFLYVILGIAIVSMTVMVGLASGTASTSGMVLGGTGGSIMSDNYMSSRVSTSGVNSGMVGNFNNEFYSRGLIALGMASLDVNTTTNDSVYHTFDGQQQVEFSGGALVTDEYGMEDGKSTADAFNYMSDDPTPSHQLVGTEFTQVGYDGGRYKSASVINDADITTSMRAEGNGGGIWERHYSVAQAGFDPSQDTINYEKEDRGSSYFGDKGGTGYDGYFDWVWKDHSTPFEVVNNSSFIVNKTVNETLMNEVVGDVVSDETSTNEVVDEPAINET